VRSLVERDAGSACDALVVCAAQVHPEHARSGVAAQLLSHLMTVARDAGLHRVVAPLRLTAKHLHPRVAIDEYVRWRRPDGEAHDPWLRTHERMGARGVATTPASQHFKATVEQWRAWTGLALESSGEHLVAGALAPLRVDLDSGTAQLLEPGVWVRHR
jgi:hypothetical protein